MSESTFYIVDVFAEQKYAGNQLAVVLEGERFSTEEMQRIAKEMNYSENARLPSGRADNIPSMENTRTLRRT